MQEEPLTSNINRATHLKVYRQLGSRYKSTVTGFAVVLYLLGLVFGTWTYIGLASDSLGKKHVTYFSKALSIYLRDVLISL